MRITTAMLQNVMDWVHYSRIDEHTAAILETALENLKDTHVCATYDAHPARMIRCAHCGCIIKNSEAVSPEMPTSGVYEELLVCKECAEQEKRDIDRMEKEYNQKRNADKMQTVYDDYMQLQPLPLKDSP